MLMQNFRKAAVLKIAHILTFFLKIVKTLSFLKTYHILTILVTVHILTFSEGSTLKCLCTNAQGIVNKHYDFQAVVDLYDPDIIGISETWLNGKISYKEYCPDDFHKPIRQDRTDTKDGRGGGVF